MPPDSLTLAVSTGLGISVVAGIISGICYVLAHGIGSQRSRKPEHPWQCAVCGYNFRSNDGVSDPSKLVTCVKCRAKVCRTLCSQRDSVQQEGWICQICRKRNESWFKAVFGVLQPNKELTWNVNMDRERIGALEEDIEKLRKKDKEEIRDFIEKLVCGLVGGDVDDVAVSKLYNDKTYENMFGKYHADLSNALTDLGSALHISIANLPSTGDTPCSAHASLKLLIQRIVQEAIDLPRLTKAVAQSPIESDELNRTYEDLLATAVLNKVIQNYQDEYPSSSANSVSSHYSSSSKPRKEKEYFFGTETLNKKWKSSGDVPDLEAASHSSLEDWVRSDSSLGSTKFVDHMSLTIHQRIEETSPTDSDNEDEKPEVIHTASINSISGDAEDADWQSNWYLRKRRFNGTHSPVPVPMLVPNPTRDAKVLIGDREAEDTSDLSDAASDYGETEYTPGINTILVDSKTVIGGQNLFNGVNISSEDEGVEAEAVNGNESGAFASLDSNTEQDSEYTERYATLPKTILKTPTPKKRSTVLPTQNGDVFSKNVDSTENFQTPPKGLYSVREKEKWKHAVHLEHNPYSRENIERRLSTRSSESSTGSPFGRDYYVREAAKPKGARKVVNGTEFTTQLSWPPPVQFGTGTEEYQNVKAVPVQVEELSSLDAPNVLDLSSDSDLSIERTYNPHTGEITETLGEKTDENHNDTSLVEIKAADAVTVEENVSQNLVPSQIKHYEQITQCKNPSVTTQIALSVPKVRLRNNERTEMTTTPASEDTFEETVQDEPVNDCTEPKTEESTPDEAFIDLSPETSDDEPEVSINTSVDTDPEILDLQDKHIVKHLLDEYANLYPNLTKVPSGGKAMHERSVSRTREASGLPSVQDLKKMFEDTAEIHFQEPKLDTKQIYSLTARSIPRQVRQELKSQGDLNGNESSDDKVKNGAITSALREELTEEELSVFPKTKTAIEFFEHLNK